MLRSHDIGICEPNKSNILLLFSLLFFLEFCCDRLNLNTSCGGHKLTRARWTSVTTQRTTRSTSTLPGTSLSHFKIHTNIIKTPSKFIVKCDHSWTTTNQTNEQNNWNWSSCITKNGHFCHSCKVILEQTKDSDWQYKTRLRCCITGLNPFSDWRDVAQW